MATFALNEAYSSGPPHQVMTTEDPRLALVAAYRRCRMKKYDEALTASWTGVDAVLEDGEHVPLLEFRRVDGGVRVEALPLRSALPRLNPADYFELRIEDGIAIIEQIHEEQP